MMKNQNPRSKWATTRAQLTAAGLVRDPEEAAAYGTLNHPPMPSGRALDLLRELLAPLAPERFFAEYWERQHLHSEPGNTDRLAGIVSLADLSGLFVGSRLKLSDVKVVASGFAIAPGRYAADTIQSASDLVRGRVDGQKLKELAHDGATIILDRVHEQLPSLHTFCTLLGKALRQKVWANCYITLPGGEGFGAHYDTHDVFVLQIDGAKKWRIQPPPLRLPTADIPHRVLNAPFQGPVEEIFLEQGGILYLPRGEVHSASCADRQIGSVHITIGMHPITCSDVIVEALRAAALGDERLRRSFVRPPANGRSTLPRNAEISALVGELAANLDCEAAYARLCWEIEGGRTSGPTDLMGRPSTNRSARYRFADDCDLVMSDGATHLFFRGVHVKIPESVDVHLRELWTRPSFVLADVPPAAAAPGLEETIDSLLDKGIIVPE